MRMIVFLYLLVPSAFLFAATDLPNASDYPRLERFPDSYIVQYAKRDAKYRLILGSLEKVNGVVTPEKEQQIAGELTQITYRIPERGSSDEAFSMIESQLKERGAHLLFKCVGRACGSSNQWANGVFRYSRLYGVDGSQLFSVYRLNNQYFSFYSVQRGNKRVYLRLDVLVEKVMGMQGQLSEGGGFPFAGNESELAALVEYLHINPERMIWLVGRDISGISRQQQVDRANRKIAALKARIVERNINPERIFLHSLGGFSPQQGADILVFIE